VAYQIKARTHVCELRDKKIDELGKYIAQKNAKSHVVVATDPFIICHTEFLNFINSCLAVHPNIFSTELKTQLHQGHWRYADNFGWRLLITVDEVSNVIWIEHAEEIHGKPTPKIEETIKSFLQR